MILTTLDELARYRCLGGAFAAAIEWLAATDLAALPEGRHAIDGERVFVICERMTPKPFGPDTVWEAHDRYADIQCLAEGAERFGWAPRTDDLPVRTPYDPAGDKVFYEPEQVPAEWVDLHPGRAIIVFPEDTHAPCVAAGAAGESKRVVVKVLIG